MTEYEVIWKIDIEAESAKKAAGIALEIQRDSDSTATVFTVISSDGYIDVVDITYERSLCCVCERNEVDKHSPLVEYAGRMCHDCFNRHIKEMDD